MSKRAKSIVLAVVLGCTSMALVETVIQPGYVIKSAIKLVLFAGTVLAFRGTPELLRPKGLGIAALLGGGIFAAVLGAFFLFRSFIDLDTIAAGLLAKENVSRENFLWVALYISIVNSFLEELFFRGLAYLKLRRHTGERFAAMFSAAAFSLYHVGILSGWFSWWIYGLCLLGLFVGGLIFNALDRRGSILPSWIAHAAANLSINTIGLMMFGLLPG